MSEKVYGEFNACTRIIVRSMCDMGATSEQVLKFLNYGTHIGISVRYDDCAVQSVRDWLSE